MNILDDIVFDNSYQYLPDTYEITLNVNHKKLLSGPGGSTKGAGIGPALCECVRQGFNFDYYVSVSYSSVIAVPLAVGMLYEIEQKSSTVKPGDFFDVNPMTKNGKISFWGHLRAIGSILAPKKINSFGVQNVQKLLKKFVTKEIFEEYQKGNYPIIYICAVEVVSQDPVIWNIKDPDVTYETYLDMVSASSRIPIWTQPQKVTYRGETKWYYDGGMTDVNASRLVLDLHNDIREIVSIYPQNPFNITYNKTLKGLVGPIDWTINTMLKDVMKNDIIIEQNMSKNKDIKLTQIFLPDILQSLYDTDLNRLKQLKEESIKQVKKSLTKP